MWPSASCAGPEPPASPPPADGLTGRFRTPDNMINDFAGAPGPMPSTTADRPVLRTLASPIRN
jgi:hypothetical protein